MIKTPTVFVLGAGASRPYGYPTGEELRDRILLHLHERGACFKQLLTLGLVAGDLQRFAKEFREADPESIDDFLGRHPDLIDTGKKIIAAELIPCENGNSLTDTWSEDLRGLSPEEQERRRAGRWYSYLWRNLLKTRTFEELEGNRVSFITFNYDRSLEQYLFTVLKENYEKDEPSCAEMVSHFRIIHVYGQLGKLDWQDAREGRAYSPTITDGGIRRAADSLSILSEGSEDSPEFAQARDALRAAHRVLFLGFGYHGENLRRLGVPNVLVRGASPFGSSSVATSGTAFGLKGAETAAATKSFAGERINLGREDRDCLLFLRENESLVE